MSWLKMLSENHCWLRMNLRVTQAVELSIVNLQKSFPSYWYKCHLNPGEFLGVVVRKWLWRWQVWVWFCAWRAAFIDVLSQAQRLSRVGGGVLTYVSVAHVVLSLSFTPFCYSTCLLFFIIYFNHFLLSSHDSNLIFCQKCCFLLHSEFQAWIFSLAATNAFSTSSRADGISAIQINKIIQLLYHK